MKESLAFILNDLPMGFCGHINAHLKLSHFGAKRSSKIEPHFSTCQKGYSQGGTGLLTPLFAEASIGRKENVQIGDVQPADSGWIVLVTLLDSGKGSLLMA